MTTNETSPLGSGCNAELGQEWRTDVARIWRKVYGGAQCDASAFEFAAEIEAAAKASERKSLAQRLAAEAALEGFGCACTPQRVCGTCTARDAIFKALAPLMRELGA